MLVKRPLPAAELTCADWNGNMPPVRLVDHTGLATGCTAALDTPYRTPPPDFATPGPNAFHVIFSFGCANDPMTTDLDLWARPYPGPQAKYVLTADRRYTTGGCMIDSGSRQVVVELEEPVQQSDVQIVDVENGSSSYYEEDSATGLDFNLEFQADKSTYATTDAINASAILNVSNHESGSPSDAALGGSGGGLIAFGVEQLAAIYGLDRSGLPTAARTPSPPKIAYKTSRRAVASRATTRTPTSTAASSLTRDSICHLANGFLRLRRTSTTAGVPVPQAAASSIESSSWSKSSRYVTQETLRSSTDRAPSRGSGLHCRDCRCVVRSRWRDALPLIGDSSSYGTCDARGDGDGDGDGPGADACAI